MNTKWIASAITSLRQERRWTQRQLSKQLGVSHQAVSKWENGDALPDLETSIAMARLFGVPLDRLLNPSPEDPRPRSSFFDRLKPISQTSEVFEDEDEMDDADDLEEEDDEEEESLAGEELPFRPRSRSAERDEEQPPAGQATDAKLKLLMQIAPFISREVLDEKFLRYIEKNEVADYRLLEQLAPFVSREVLGKAIDRVIDGEVDPQFIVSIAPFIAREDLVRLVKMNPDQGWVENHLMVLAPFLPKSYLDELLRSMDF